MLCLSALAAAAVAPTPDTPAPAAATPAPAPTYKCVAGACAASPSGVDILTCASLCKPAATPAPPATAAPPPGQQKYQCINGMCNPTPDGYGIDLATCEALPCGAPPTQQLYKCTSNQCTESDTGSSLADCQQLCHAPTPPAPSKSCADGQCSGCLYKYVLQILEAVSECLTLHIVKCISTSIADIENLLRIVTKCTPLVAAANGNATVDAAGVAAVRQLQALAAAAGDAGLRDAVQKLAAVHDAML